MTTVIASALAVRGVDVCILSMNKGEEVGFPLHPSVRLLSLHMEYRSANFSDFTRWRAIRRFVQQEKINVWVDVDTILSWYSIPATIGLPVRVVSWEHFHRRINPGGVGQRLRRQVGRLLATRYSYSLVTLTERDRHQYLSSDRCLAPINAIPNPVTLDSSEADSVKGNVVLAAGRLVHQKGFDRLLDAWALVGARNPSWRLRIVGSGPDREGLEAQAKRLGIGAQLELVPASDDMARHYASASVYAMASRFEGLPLVLIEAKRSGLPIVSFDCSCGPSDVIRHEIDGILVEDGDIVGLAAAIQRLIDDRKLRSEFSLEAKRDRRFDLEPIVSKWVDLLKVS